MIYFLLDLDHVGVSLAQGQLIAADIDLHRIAQGGCLADKDLHAFGDAHIHDAALYRALPWSFTTFTVSPIFA